MERLLAKDPANYSIKEGMVMKCSVSKLYRITTIKQNFF